MQLYGRGLRRRLPPMLDGDQRRIRMVYSLLFSLPGTPVLFYGEEIGMGENLDGRGPRWPSGRRCSGPPSRDGGFSTAGPSTFRGAARARARSGPSTSTSATSAATPTRCCRSSGTSSTPTGRAPSWPGAPTRCSTRAGRRAGARPPRATPTASPSSPLHNFAGPEGHRDLPLAGLAGRDLYDVLAADGSTVRVGDDGRLKLTLPPYGYRWLRSAPWIERGRSDDAPRHHGRPPRPSRRRRVAIGRRRGEVTIGSHRRSPRPRRRRYRPGWSSRPP